MGCAASKPEVVDAANLASVESNVSMRSLKGESLPCCTLEKDGKVYSPAQLPLNESERLSVLHATSIMDTPPDPRFDEITKLLCGIFKVPIALVVLVDGDRCWWKSASGISICSVDRTKTMCPWTLLPTHPEVLFVRDTHKDARFVNCPLVTEAPHIRFYAGCPLVTSLGHRIGTLSIIDMQPREFDAEGANLLANFAEIVLRQIEKTTIGMSRSYLIKKQARSLLRALDCFSEGLMLCSLTPQSWQLLYVNDAWTKLTGTAEADAVGTDLWSHAELLHRAEVAPTIEAALRAKGSFSVVLRLKGAASYMDVTFRPADSGGLGDNLPTVGIPSHIPWTAAAGGDSSTQHFYFGTVRAAKPREARQRQAASQRQQRWAWQDNEPFPEVLLGPVLGQGSFGKVYRACWQGSPVAIKVMTFQAGQADKQCAAGRVEGVLGLRLSHPNVVPIYKTARRSCKVPLAALHSVPAPSIGACCDVAPYAPSYASSSNGDVPTALCSAAGDGFRQNSLAGLSAGGVTGTSTWTTTSFRSSSLESEGAESSGGGSVAAADPAYAAPARLAGSACCSSDCSASGSPRLGGGGECTMMYEVWVMMELCDMGTLVDACERGWFRNPRHAPISASTPDMYAVCETAREIASALNYLHEHGMVHGDLTGSNVLLTSCSKDARGFTAKVCDFNLSRMLDDGLVMTNTIGTTTHMPPELLADGQLSTQTDVYGLGVILWELYHGERAWAGMHPMQVMFNVAVKKRSLTFAPSAPREFVELVAACMHPERTQRLSCSEVLARLSDITDHL